MSKGVLTIHRELEKENYRKSPLGQLEKKLNSFYKRMKEEGKSLPENLAKEIYDIREAQEKAYENYVNERIVKDREAVDNLLMEAFNKELEIINKYDEQGNS